MGVKIIHAVTLPSSMLHDTLSPVMAPAAMNMGSQESITVRPIHAGPNTRWFSAATQVVIMMVARPEGLIPERRRKMELTEGVGTDEALYEVRA